jgi:hypothetical protein
MLDTRRAFCAHLTASGLFATVAPLTSDDDLATTSKDLPACFVAYAGGTLAKREAATLHVFVPGFAPEVGPDVNAADDALGLTQQVADYLKDEHIWYADPESEGQTGRAWQIDLSDEEGLQVRAGRFREKHAFYVLAVPVTEV